jgi:heat shock protein HslJ
VEGLIGFWQWQSTQPPTGPAVVVNDPTRYTITFAPDGSVQVKADCNQVGGAYTLSGSKLTITLGPATLVACPPDSQDDEFLGGLNQVTGFTVVGNNLELGLSGGGQMVFAPSTQPELVGPLWKLTAYNNGRGGLVSIVEGTQPTAVFEQSLVTGSGGCNTYSAPISSTPKTLSIGAIAATHMACQEAVMDQETAYFSALGRTSTYSIESGDLVLVDSGGARQAEFTL